MSLGTYLFSEFFCVIKNLRLFCDENYMPHWIYARGVLKKQANVDLFVKFFSIISLLLQEKANKERFTFEEKLQWLNI